MPDAASIIATLAAIKNSMDIVKAVRDADYDLDKAILKEKIVILVDSLLEAKIQAGETLELIQEKDKKIFELENLLKFKEKIVRNNDRYFQIDENGRPVSDPFCSSCWDSEQKVIYLVSPQENNENYHKCPRCKNEYGSPKIYFG
jgi:hypothetical protein